VLEKVELGIIRDGKALSLSATLKAIEPSKIEFIPPPRHPLSAGATFLNPAGGNKNKGVLVDHVKKDSITDNFGLQQGNLMIGINREKF
jgi:S1-C subfamily serine protease